MHKQVIVNSLSKPNTNVFDAIIERIEWEYNKPCNSVQELKERENMKKKGDLWEAFCLNWLQPSYDRVLTLSQFNEEYPDIFQTKQDNGIDLIAITSTGKWHAIQCKYRKTKYLNWSTLSTFIALCERTKCFDKYIVITNCKGITNKLIKSPKDKSICYRTLSNTPRDHWLKMVGMTESHQLTGHQPRSPAELRQLRLAHFEKQ